MKSEKINDFESEKDKIMTYMYVCKVSLPPFCPPSHHWQGPHLPHAAGVYQELQTHSNQLDSQGLSPSSWVYCPLTPKTHLTG